MESQLKNLTILSKIFKFLHLILAIISINFIIFYGISIGLKGVIKANEVLSMKIAERERNHSELTKKYNDDLAEWNKYAEGDIEKQLFFINKYDKRADGLLCDSKFESFHYALDDGNKYYPYTPHFAVISEKEVSRRFYSMRPSLPCNYYFPPKIIKNSIFNDEVISGYKKFGLISFIFLVSTFLTYAFYSITKGLAELIKNSQNNTPLA